MTNTVAAITSPPIEGNAVRETNKLAPDDRAVHDWYRFVLSFPPHLVGDYLGRFGATADTRVLDPFCGTGTTVVECKKRGIPSVGIEINPVAQFAGAVKTDWTPDPDGLLAYADEVAEIALDTFHAQGIEDDPARGSSGDVPTLPPRLRILPAEQWVLLLTNSISPLPLHKTLTLLDILKRNNDERYGRHALLALANALPFTISNLRFGPEVGLGTIKTDVSVIGTWHAGVRAMAEDLRALSSYASVPSVVHHADARQMLDVLEPESIDMVITSPPYPNEKDYTRTTRLESVLLGFITSKEELRALKRGLVRSNTRGVYKGDDDDRWVAHFPEIQRIAEAIEARRIELGKTSGFERLYARVTKLYFGGMARHLADLRTVLRPGALLAYVVGDQASYLRVMIRTGQLLAEIGKSLGYEVVGIDLFRTRMATATKAQLREEVVLLRWPDQPLRSPGEKGA
ncbi:MAG: DNA methyltransferase [Thermomicrobiales bacterium]